MEIKMLKIKVFGVLREKAHLSTVFLPEDLLEEVGLKDNDDAILDVGIDGSIVIHPVDQRVGDEVV
jgi:hypothetical protein